MYRKVCGFLILELIFATKTVILKNLKVGLS